MTETSMSIIFTCEKCGKRFKVDERSQGRRGRCSHCGHVMRIPGAGVSEHAHATAPATKPDAESPFKLSPPEPHPQVREVILPPAANVAPHQPNRPFHSPSAPASSVPVAEQPNAHEPHIHFELLDDDADPASNVA